MLLEVLNDRKEIMYRALSIALSSVFFSHIPLLLFLIYMGHYGFFSYDFFSEGVFGLKVFFFITSIITLLMSLALFGWIIPIVEKWKKGKFNIWQFVGFFTFNLFFCLIVFISFPKNGDVFGITYIFTIGLFLSIHISFLFHAKPNEQFATLIGVIFIITFMSLHLREQASSMLANGLKSYGMGGGIEVSLMPKMLANEKLNGKLILLSPKNIYIRLDGSEGVSTIDRSRFDVITTET